MTIKKGAWIRDIYPFHYTWIYNNKAHAWKFVPLVHWYCFYVCSLIHRLYVGAPIRWVISQVLFFPYLPITQNQLKLGRLPPKLQFLCKIVCAPGNLFVLFVMLRSPNRSSPPSLPQALDIVGNPWWVGVHRGGLAMSRPPEQESLNIKQFKEYAIKTTLNIFGKVGPALPSIGKSSISRIKWKWLCNF